MRKLVILMICAITLSVSAVADDYVPLVRDGVQWVNQREHYNSYQDYLNGPPAKWYYTYEI